MKFKKFFEAKAFLMSLALASLACGFTACSSDDDGDGDGGGSGESSLEAPKYAEASARYEIEDDEISSIELTESGEYVITKNHYYGYAKTRSGKLASAIRKRAPLSTRGYDSGIIHGKYTQVSETVFRLEGFGTITIVGSTDNAASLKIEENGKGERIVGAEIREEVAASNQTTWLCRTWKLKKVNAKMTVLGKVEFNKTANVDNYTELMNALYSKIEELEGIYGGEDEEDYYEDYYGEGNTYYEDDYEDYEETPDKVTFTKAGSYMVTYKEGGLAISTWTWEDVDNGIIRYSWDYDYLYDPEESGICDVWFGEKSLTVHEVLLEEIDEDTGRSLVKIEETFYLDEDK